MLNKQNTPVFFALAALVVLTVWMQFILIEEPEIIPTEAELNDPDYYVENFRSSGLDKDGKRYELSADRLVHFPADDKSLLDRPHLVQIAEGNGPTHIYAESGWLFAGGTEILLTGNVRVVRSQGGSPGGGATTERMRIKLKPKN